MVRVVVMTMAVLLRGKGRRAGPRWCGSAKPARSRSDQGENVVDREVGIRLAGSRT